jgi:hypothetical protein
MNLFSSQMKEAAPRIIAKEVAIKTLAIAYIEL